MKLVRNSHYFSPGWGDFEGIARFLGGGTGGRGEFVVSIKVSRRKCRKLTANKLQLGEQIWRKS